MHRLILLAFLAVASGSWAQESTETETETETADEESVVVETEDEPFEGLTEEELEELDIGAQEDYLEEDEDVFKPTDAVSYQQSVQFPVDI